MGLWMAVPERVGCAAFTRGNGEDIAGSAPGSPRFLAIEVPLPWKENPWKSRGAPPGLHETLARARDRKVKVKPLALEPDATYSAPGLTRVMLLTKPHAPAPVFERVEFLVPEASVANVAGALLGEPGKSLAEFESCRLDPSAVRDLMICTHGADDPCCGTLGYPIYRVMREGAMLDHPQRRRVWRVSHIGGHRFAPTVLDFPEGRCWGHLDEETARLVALRDGRTESLRGQYRGWGALGFFEQMVERELFLREGWAWTTYPKVAQVLAMSGVNRTDVAIEVNPALAKDPPLWTEVRLAFGTPDGRAEAYSAIIEFTGRASGIGQCGGPLNDHNTYQVTRLEHLNSAQDH